MSENGFVGFGVFGPAVVGTDRCPCSDHAAPECHLVGILTDAMPAVRQQNGGSQWGVKSGNRAMIAALLPIYGITLIDVFGYMIMIPLLPYLAQKYGASGVEVGALLATMAVASTIAAPLWGALSDRVGRKPIVLISQGVSLVGYVGLALAPTLGMLFIARGVAGIGGGNLGVTQSCIADVTAPEYRDPRLRAPSAPSLCLGIVLGPVTGGFWSSSVTACRFSWRPGSRSSTCS